MFYGVLSCLWSYVLFLVLSLADNSMFHDYRSCFKLINLVSGAMSCSTVGL